MPKKKKSKGGADILAEAAVQRFGERLDERQQRKLRSTARKLHQNAEALQRYLLSNSDEPATRFAAGDEES